MALSPSLPPRLPSTSDLHDVLVLVLLCHSDALTTFLELVGGHLAQDLHVLDEVQLKPTLFQVVLSGGTGDQEGRGLPQKGLPIPALLLTLVLIGC